MLALQPQDGNNLVSPQQTGPPFCHPASQSVSLIGLFNVDFGTALHDVNFTPTSPRKEKAEAKDATSPSDAVMSFFTNMASIC